MSVEIISHRYSKNQTHPRGLPLLTALCMRPPALPLFQVHRTLLSMSLFTNNPKSKRFIPSQRLCLPSTAHSVWHLVIALSSSNRSSGSFD
ncbi:hypothetical protein RRG08_046169 [Elysia crispata]|uniref:Uncharacterized protein n=1 Tax=Elysia crispata TaxID=231223 RepID=A0AAE0XN63_9GAST|nr:hypothetical protein RRG08_046169 [Elysia crispata]